MRALAPERVEGRGIVAEGAFCFLRLTDSEGNTVGFFSVDAAR